MSVELRFLGWDAPVTTRVREFLLAAAPGGAADLARDLIIVPTSQAGRRLREALAVHCSSQGTALPHVRVVTPPSFLHPEGTKGAAAPLEVAAVWADVLMRPDLGSEIRGDLGSEIADLPREIGGEAAEDRGPGIEASRYAGLFPARTPSRDFGWALGTGEMVQQLRSTLADGGLRIADVVRDHGGLLEEKERWRDLAALETAYLERLETVGLRDPLRCMLQEADSPEPPAGIGRIVMAAVPDPTPLLVRRLARLADRVPIVILVHAPEALAACFDEWGRPVPRMWRGRPIDIPAPEDNVVLTGTPSSQSRQALELIAGEAERFGPADVALGVPDEGVVAFLQADLANAGLVPFDPSGKAAGRHPLGQLLRAFRGLCAEGDYPSAGLFLRHCDLLDCLQQKHHVPPARLLEELDLYQNQHLPQSLDGLVQGLDRPAGAGPRSDAYPNLARAARAAAEWVRAFQAGEGGAALRDFLQSVYESRVLSARRAEDSDFVAVAEAVDEGLRLLAQGAPAALGLDRVSQMDLLLWHLDRQSYYPEPEEANIDLEGWLELPWNDAPFLIVTGMNDGKVPDSRPDDVFLPDTLRRQLGLRHDDDRMARDAFLTTSLVESRRGGGRVCFLAGKTGAAGDVLKPSRLLFACGDAELPGRALRLFGSPAQEPPGHPSSISFLLEAAPPPDVPPADLELRRMAVTTFRDYLYCPFRYYLKHVLGMKAFDDLKTELDAMDFGSLVHDALRDMAQNEEMRRTEDAARLQDFLCARAADWVRERLGSPLPLPVEVQLEAARERLRQAARIQVKLVREGWEILHAEINIRGEIGGVQVRGKIDRIERHRETGRLRLLDYKTSERASRPEAAHLGPVPAGQECRDYARLLAGGKERRWTDLQVPLYAILLDPAAGPGGPFDLGYFNLPKAPGDTGIALWDDPPPNLLESARACAEGVISDIRARRFWPPARRTPNDEFEGLFPSDPALYVDAESFAAFLRREDPA